MMKKAAILLLAFVLILSCAGCGGSSGGSTTAAANVLENTGDVIEQSKFVPKSSKADLGYQLDPPEKGEEIAVITMETGEVFKLRFFAQEAPKAVYSFKYHAIKGYYNGLVFHRVIKNFMIQGGDPQGTGRGGESVWGRSDPFEDEFHSNLLNIDGSVAMANTGANSNGSQFFINVTQGVKPQWDSYRQGYELYKTNPDAFTAAYGRWIKMDEVPDEMIDFYNEHGGNPHLDGYYSTTGEGHTVFAQVFEGMEQVEKLSEAETDPESDRPLTDMVIKSVEIVKY